MRTIIIISVFLALLGCKKDNVITDNHKKPEKKITPITIKTGWVNPNTYTVKALGNTEKEAIEKAKYKILRDIVRVRVRKQSRYLDISKISVEFKDPLKNGRIIKKYTQDGKILIKFQISDKGLKKKFERK